MGARCDSVLTPAPLKLFALERGLEHHDVPPSGLQFPASFSSPSPNNVLLTASFGSIIPTPLLKPFAHAINVHPSVLPKYRGAAPLQWAIANNDTSTGVSVQTMARREDGVDSGAILGAVDSVPIHPEDTYSSLLPDLSHIGGRLLVQVLRQLRDGTAKATPQEGQVTKAPKITTQTSRIDWGAHSASHLDARHRGFGHHAPLWAELPDRGMSVQFVSLRRGERPPGSFEERPGLAVFDKPQKAVFVATVDGWVQVDTVKPAGRRETPVAEWWNGLAPEARKQGWTVFA